jgi:hypothetical protein
MGGFESDNEEKMPKIMIKLSKKVNNDGPRDDEGLVLNVGGSSQYYQRQGHQLKGSHRCW